MTEDMAKILVFNSREVVHFHLKTHPTREKDETRPLGRGIHPYKPDPLLLYFATTEWSDKQDEPPQLKNLGRAIYHKAAVEAI